ncbi:MAG: riboflavin biosynthesis protein RibF [Planctomycetes bacterium]|nr:riboflavin biosynthesis protein RibF [Planctomycetota bacterium]
MERIDPYLTGAPLPHLHGAVATIGVFDGVHLGHRAILDRTLTWARTERRPAVVLTFAHHPDLVVRGREPARLQSLAQRLREIERAGLDATLVLPFDAALRELSAEEFTARILVGSLQLRGLVLGHDTAVGRDRRGDARLLDGLGAQHGFTVEAVGRIAIDGEVVSSTRIREALERGDLPTASRLLGRAPALLGRVVPGDGRGRQLGVPTANLALDHACAPANGVYAVLVLEGDTRRRGLCNIGVRPTLTAGTNRTVEVHLLDWSGDLYGRELEVVFLQRLREERRFAGKEELVAQIHADRAAAEVVLRRLPD